MAAVPINNNNKSKKSSPQHFLDDMLHQMKVEVPYVVSLKDVDVLIKSQNAPLSASMLSMYV